MKKKIHVKARKKKKEPPMSYSERKVKNLINKAMEADRDDENDPVSVGSIVMWDVPDIKDESDLGWKDGVDTVKDSILTSIQKSHPGGRSSNQLSPNDGKFVVSEIISPRHDPHKLENMLDRSWVLRANIDAYVSMLASTDFKFHPLIKTSKKEIIDEETGERKQITVREDTKEQIEPKLAEDIQNEYARLVTTFNAINLDLSFKEINERRVFNQETFGYTFWEIERDKMGDFMGATPMDTKTVRMMKDDGEKIDVTQLVRNPITFEFDEMERSKVFCKFIQKIGNKVVYFKEFGDPRFLDANTGEYYEDEDDPTIPEGARQATEILHFYIYHPSTRYGSPRWIAHTPNILAVRSADTVNFFLLHNNAIPPVVCIVEGVKSNQIEQKLKEHLAINKGAKSFNKMLVIQAAAKSATANVGSGAGVVKPSIRFEFLSDVISKEGMFMEFIKSTEDRITGSFRLPNLLVGRMNDVNRATAQVAMELAEKQVFTPLRMAFDFIINSRILTDMKIKYWRFETQAPRLDDSADRAKMITEFVKEGILVPDDGRDEAEGILNKDLPEIDEPWMKKPLKLTIAEVRKNNGIPPEEPSEAEDSDQPDPDSASQATREQTEDGSNGSDSDEQGSEKGLTKLDEDEIAVKILSKFLEFRDGLETKGAYLYVNEQAEKIS